MAMNPKEAAKELLVLAKAKSVRFPTIWDESKLMQTCGATVMLFKNEDGTFNLEGGLESLIEKYGQSVVEEKPKSKKRKADEEEDEEEAGEDGDEEGKKKKKPKAPPKTSVVAEERNRRAAEAIQEMATIYFKNKDMRKGGVFAKAAKALRECETYVSTKKEAMELKGIGKGIAAYIEEVLQNGTIQKLEELRAGIA